MKLDIHPVATVIALSIGTDRYKNAVSGLGLHCCHSFSSFDILSSKMDLLKFWDTYHVEDLLRGTV